MPNAGPGCDIAKLELVGECEIMPLAELPE